MNALDKALDISRIRVRPSDPDRLATAEWKRARKNDKRLADGAVQQWKPTTNSGNGKHEQGG